LRRTGVSIAAQQNRCCSAEETMLHGHKNTIGTEEIGSEAAGRTRLSQAQRSWLSRGIDQPGGKLPLFDRDGRRVSPQMVRACIDAGWAEPWFANPLKPDWLVCKLTETGRALVAR
jgi:hypothetical protein